MDTTHLGKELPFKKLKNPYDKVGNEPFDKEFYFIINMSVAGNYFFSPDPSLDELYKDRCFNWDDPLAPNEFW